MIRYHNNNKDFKPSNTPTKNMYRYRNPTDKIFLNGIKKAVFRIRCLFDAGSGMGKKSGSGSGINNPDQISESLETMFWDKIPT